MSKNISFGVGYDDELFWNEAVEAYPNMTPSRLFHRIVKEWLVLRKKEHREVTIDEALKVVTEYAKRVQKSLKSARSLNDF